jgi:hypothetical protein
MNTENLTKKESSLELRFKAVFCARAADFSTDYAESVESTQENLFQHFCLRITAGRIEAGG